MNDPELSDPSLDSGHWVPARRRRLLLACYVDFVLFSIPWTWFVLASGVTLPVYTHYLVFAVIELLVVRTATRSPGCALLGIRFFAATRGLVPVDRLWNDRVPFVEVSLLKAESWFSLAAGTYLLLEGSKTMVRWAMFSPAFPLFGFQPEGFAAGATSIAIGAIELTVACRVLRLHRQAVLIGIPFYLIMAVSAITSWSLWDAWSERYIVSRRAYQGVALRSGEIEQFQSVTPELVIVAIVFHAALLFLIARRMRTKRSEPAL